MKTFYIDFSGYCKIKARNADEAEEKFWKTLQRPCEVSFDDVWEIDGVEEDSSVQYANNDFQDWYANLDEDDDFQDWWAD